jgi:hypothetical protein
MKFLAAILALLIAYPAAAELDAPAGAVVLTVTGKIKQVNRDAFDPVRDGFISFHEREFAKAAEFDRAMLEEIGMEEAEIDFDGWEGPIRFQGPRLIDVLKEVGWRKGSRITTLALDGFGTKISNYDIRAHDWILATRGNGKPFGIGQRGPLWLVYDPPGDRKADKKEEGQWPWAIFLIEVH